MKKRILIFGGSGFIGKNLIIEYLKNGDKIINYDMISSNIKDENLKEVNGSINDIKKIEKIFIENENEIKNIVFLINTLHPNDDMTSDFDFKINTNIISIIKILQLLKRFNLNKIIYFSSGGAVYGNYKKEPYVETDSLHPVNFYGWSKKIVEDFIINFSDSMNFKYIILRPSNPYGEYQNIFGNQGIIGIILKKLIKNEVLDVWGTEKILKDYIYIKDLVDIYFKLLKNEKWNNIYNIASGHGTNLENVINLAEKITNKKLQVNYILKNEVTLVNFNILSTKKTFENIGEFKLTNLETGIEKFYDFLKTKKI